MDVEDEEDFLVDCEVSHLRRRCEPPTHPSVVEEIDNSSFDRWQID